MHEIKMKLNITILVIVLFTVGNVAGLMNYSNTDIYDCIVCLCYATTNCDDLQKCANEAIKYEEWEEAGAPRLNDNNEINQESYRKCMNDNNCIVNSIYHYSQNVGLEDCVCDGISDCRDRLSLHLYDKNCVNLGNSRITRYNNCAKPRRLELINPNTDCIDLNL